MAKNCRGRSAGRGKGQPKQDRTEHDSVQLFAVIPIGDKGEHAAATQLAIERLSPLTESLLRVRDSPSFVLACQKRCRTVRFAYDSIKSTPYLSDPCTPQSAPLAAIPDGDPGIVLVRNPQQRLATIRKIVHHSSKKRGTPHFRSSIEDQLCGATRASRHTGHTVPSKSFLVVSCNPLALSYRLHFIIPDDRSLIVFSVKITLYQAKRKQKKRSADPRRTR